MRKPSLIFKSRRGATATEYIVMIVLASLVVLGLTRVFGDTIKTKFSAANNELSGTLAEDGTEGGGAGGAGGGAAGSGKYGASVDPSAGASGPVAGKGGASGGKGGSKAGAGGGAGGAGAGGGGGSGGNGGSGDGSDGGGAMGGGGGGDSKRAGEEKSSFNPMILIAAFLLVGLLAYVMFKGKDG